MLAWMRERLGRLNDALDKLIGDLCDVEIGHLDDEDQAHIDPVFEPLDRDGEDD